jgi:hypothetical protein
MDFFDAALFSCKNQGLAISRVVLGYRHCLGSS